MRRQRVRYEARPVLEGLEGRALLSGGGHASAAGSRAAGAASGVKVLDARKLSLLETGQSQNMSHSPGAFEARSGHKAPAKRSLRGATATNFFPEYPLYYRLAVYVPKPRKIGGQHFQQVKPGSIGNTTATANQNVYLITHGWMPGYRTWVNSLQTQKFLPVAWQTWQNPQIDSGIVPAMPWLYQPSRGDDPDVKISALGLAQQIHKVDPTAAILVYSWIDDSATQTFAKYPESVYNSEGYTTMNGMRMAEAVTQALAPGYANGTGQVHLIGHSHGARVATVAAVALQNAAEASNTRNIVGQLTLLDSPEDDQAYNHLNNPIDIDGANFDWFYLSQLHIARTVALSGTVAADGTDVTVDSTANLVAGMGVSVGGNSPFTTIDKIVDGQHFTLNAPATPGSASFQFTPPPGYIFVDSYVSFYGSSYNNFVVNDPDQGINNQALSNVVDVDLNPLPFGEFDYALEHEYSANWYAGSGATSSAPIGLLWSPLLPKAQKNLPSSLAQTWTDSTLNYAHEFLLGPESSPATISPTFSSLGLQEDSGGLSGDASVTTNTDGSISTVTLTDDTTPQPEFQGYFYKQSDSYVGVSFNYDFSKVNDGAQLQIDLNGKLYFAMTGSVAKSALLDGSGTFTATFGIGKEFAHLGAQYLTIELVQPNSLKKSSGSSTSVTISQFHTFTL